MRETGIAAAPGGVDREIAAETQRAIQALAAESAPALDAAYVDREVLAHLRALALIDRLLGPSAHDPRIADLLARVRDLVVQHAQAASQAQSELEGACAARTGLKHDAGSSGHDLRPGRKPGATSSKDSAVALPRRDRASARPTC